MANNNEKGVYDLIKELIDCRDESIKIYRFVAHATIQLKNREWKDPFIEGDIPEGWCWALREEIKKILDELKEKS